MYPYPDDGIWISGECREAVYFPLRLGYSSTLMNVKGTMLDHMTFWYDEIQWLPGAIYIALSR
eukprot:10615232-Karenia_brevis.AAC.1